MQPESDNPGSNDHDTEDSRIFAGGSAGALHVFAHRCMAYDEPALAARALELFLYRDGATGTRAVHLHWHLLVADLTLSRWQSGYQRFLRHILPAVGDGAARTDGPSALWYLALSAPHPLTLPWLPLASEAKLHQGETDPFLALHDALALAGARDIGALDAWLAHREGRGQPNLVTVGRWLRAHAAGHQDEATALLRAASRSIARLGGSRAQQHLLRCFAAGDSLRAPSAWPQACRSGSSTDQILA